MTEKRSKLLTKVTVFGKTKLTLYSLDGLIWSSRKDELVQIQARHEAERAKLAQLSPEEGEESTEEKKDETKEVETPVGEEESELVFEGGEDGGEEAKPKRPTKGRRAPARSAPRARSKTTPQRSLPTKAKVAAKGKR